ncbi:MAG: MFS transporter [Actinomycetota bacterium]
MTRTWPRIKDVLSFRDFRHLLGLRLTTQFGDGLFQAVLVGSVVFSPEKQSTTVGFAKALAILVIPYSAIGPFAGVFIDRWPRRAILIATPLVRAAAAFLVVPGAGATIPFYAGALIVLSANRFLLTTASSITPKLVPSRDLFTANSVSTVSGTFTRFIGVVVAGQVVDATGYVPVVAVTAAVWVLTSWFASRIETDLSAARPAGTLRTELARVSGELRDGARRLVRTTRAIAPIASVMWNQLLNGLILVLALVVFRDRFDRGVGSFSWLVGATGVGILFGLATVNFLEDRMSRRAMIATSFVVSGVPMVAISLGVNRYDMLVGSFLLGLSFAWMKIPADTMTQEAVPDRYRGRVFALYDLAQNMAGVVAALVAIALVHSVSVEILVAATGVGFLLWVPVIMRWLDR